MGYIRARVAKELSGRWSDVDDVVQDICEQVCRSIHNLRDPDKFGAWLSGIVYKRIAEYWRRDYRIKEDPSGDTSWLAKKDPVMPDTDWVELEDMLAKLNNRYRKYLLLRLSGMDYDDMQKIDGLSSEGARSVCRRAMARLRTIARRQRWM